MAYKNLKDIYHSTNYDVEEEYNKRFNSIGTKHLNLWINSNFGNKYQLFYVLTEEMFLSVEKISSELKNRNSLTQGEMVGRMLNDYTNKLLYEEIIATNGIEGVKSSRSDLEKADSNKGKSFRFHFLVKKYRRLTDDKFKMYNYKNTEEIRRDYDELIADEVEEKNKLDGKLFREGPVSVTSPNGSQKEIHKGVYGEENIVSHLNQLIFLMNDKSIPTLIRIAIFHYYFGYIHPFYDGNGRMSRYISSAFLKSNYDNLLPLKLSKVIFDNKSEYYSAFDTTNHDHNRGDLTTFIIMFLKMVETAATETKTEVREYTDLLMKCTNYINNLEDKGIVDEFETEVFFIAYQSTIYDVELTIKELTRALTKSYQTIKSRIEKLIELGLVERVSRTDYKVPKDIMISINSFE